MKSISLYTERNSLIHRIGPIPKLWYIAVVIFVPILLQDVWVALICLVCSLLFLLLGKVFLKSLPVFGFVGFILLTILFIQGLFSPSNQTVLWHIGPLVFYEEGVQFAVSIILRVTAIVSSLLILVLTVRPSELIDALVRSGLSPRLGYVLLSVFQIIPEMKGRMDTIMDAQRSRGVELDGRLFERIKAFTPLMGPVILGSLIHSRERAMALEVRGFNSSGKRTSIKETKEDKLGGVISGMLICILILAMLWRVYTWLS